MTIQQALAEIAARLAVVSDEARLEAEVLLAHGLGLSRAGLLARRPDPLDPRAWYVVQGLLVRRLAHEPLAYILGQREFHGRRFRVTRDVLIPRPETELLVEQALIWWRAHTDLPAGSRLVDVGTGAGALAVTLAAELPTARVVATDRSRVALTLARYNADQIAVSPRIDCAQTDLLNGFRPAFPLIVANLPYIPSARLAHLAPEVRDWEPRLALDGGPDGLDLVRRLLELDGEQGEVAVRLALQAVPDARVMVLGDLAGLPRALRIERG